MERFFVLLVTGLALGCDADLTFFERVPSLRGTGVIANPCPDENLEAPIYTHRLTQLSMSSIVGDSDRLYIQAAWTTAASPGDTSIVEIPRCGAPATVHNVQDQLNLGGFPTHTLIDDRVYFARRFGGGLYSIAAGTGRAQPRERLFEIGERPCALVGLRDRREIVWAECLTGTVRAWPLGGEPRVVASGFDLDDRPMHWDGRELTFSDDTRVVRLDVSTGRARVLTTLAQRPREMLGLDEWVYIVPQDDPTLLRVSVVAEGGSVEVIGDLTGPGEGMVAFDGELFIASASGLYRFDPESLDLRRFSDRPGRRIWADSSAVYVDSADAMELYTLWRVPRP
ncbi:MAG: hypothetical protein AAF654_02125 [Myxococcota bacterium]